MSVTAEGRGDVTQFCNAAGYIDRRIFGVHHMYGFLSLDIARIYPTDPEGLLSTLTALLTTYIGVEVGVIINKERDIKNQHEITRGLRLLIQFLLWGVMLTFVGAVLTLWVPFNKRVW